MTNSNNEIPYLNIWISLFVGFGILVLFTIKKLKTEDATKTKKNKNKNKKSQSTTISEKTSKKEIVETKGNSKKSNYRTRNYTNEKFSHNWLKTSFKGHTGQVTSADLSHNGKYLASSSDDVIDADDSAVDSKRLSRRQRKNRKLRTEKESPPTSTSSSPEMCKKKPPPKKKPIQELAVLPVLRAYTKLNMDTEGILLRMKKHILRVNQLQEYGFPIEIMRGYASIYKFGMYNVFDVNAREFIPRSVIINQVDDLPRSDSDSGKGSSGSESPSSNISDDNDTDDVNQVIVDNRVNHHVKQVTGFKRDCCRCKLPFFIDNNNKYLTNDQCVYHHGKLHHNYDGSQLYTCCNGPRYSTGCQIGKRHVWNGIVDGLNGPFPGYVSTESKYQNPSAYALDCEMCYTVEGLELTKVTIVSITGSIVYDTFVKPQNQIIDYNTRYSGITAKDLNGSGVKTLKQVQSDLLRLIYADTILIGHGLENDLRALRLIHKTIIDTSVIYPHFKGLPYRRSLKNLTKSYLRRDIQENLITGHNSLEDARACMEIVLDAIRRSSY